MKFFRSKFWILLLILALTASIGACGYRPEPEKTESGQTVFRLGFSETPNSLDPYTAETDAAAAAISLLYDTLFYADIETGRYINSVCQEYTVQPAAADGAKSGPSQISPVMERNARLSGTWPAVWNRLIGYSSVFRG